MKYPLKNFNSKFDIIIAIDQLLYELLWCCEHSFFCRTNFILRFDYINLSILYINYINLSVLYIE